MDSNATSELHSMGIRQGQLDLDDHAIKVQRSIGNNRLDRPVVLDGELAVYPMVLTPDKTLYLWRQAIRHKSLFWNNAMKTADSFTRCLFDPSWMFFEVYKSGYLCGFVYFTDIIELENVEIHAVFFDRKLTDKLTAAKLLVHWMFDNYPMERIESPIAQPFFATQRFMQKVGFKYEGTRRKGALLHGTWVDQKLYSIIREEV